MLNLKFSAAAAILAVTAAVSAGASHIVTKMMVDTSVKVDCPRQSPPAADNRGVPLGGPPLPTDQGKRF